MNDKKKKYLPTYPGCFVCGQKEKNSSSLNVRFRITEHGVEVPFKAQVEQEGYKNIVHGGIMCSLLDETIGWAVAVARKKFFVTAELTVRFIKPLFVGQDVIVKGRALEHKSRYSIAEGEIVDSNGVIYAKATGKFFLMSDQEALKINQYLSFKNDDVDILAFS
jgi:uncharacterized protein (TIGR00369 family)